MISNKYFCLLETMKSTFITKHESYSKNFENLLGWLDNDRNKAGGKYEYIRHKLIKTFVARGSYQAEELADETIERVTRKSKYLRENYIGKPDLYFYAVARNVFLEWTRKPKVTTLSEKLSAQKNDNSEKEKYHGYLELSLQKLTPKQVKFILQYYKGDKDEKIENRQRLASDLGISVEATRVRAFRIRKKLQKDFLLNSQQNE